MYNFHCFVMSMTCSLGVSSYICSIYCVSVMVVSLIAALATNL